MKSAANLTRRRALQWLGFGLSARVLRGYAIDHAAEVYFTHGVASGDPLSDRVILWSRVVPAAVGESFVPVRWQIAEDAQFQRIAAEGETLSHADRDFTVKVDATGLQPNHRYFYRFDSAGETSDVGQTKTLPVGAVDEFRLAVASCSNYPQGYFHAYRDIAEHSVDVVLHLGDYLYEYPLGQYAHPVAEQTLGRVVEPAHELLALEDYRMRYGLYRTDADLQAAHAAHPWICIWDDHELANDTWRAGAKNHNEGEGDFAERMAIARRVYHEWMPIRTAAQSNQSPIYRQFQIGDLADLIMLDTRLQGRDQQLVYERDIEAAGGIERFLSEKLNDPERTLLGVDQEVWLASQLAASRDRGAIWQVLGQQVIMGRVITPRFRSETMADPAMPERTKRWLAASQRYSDYRLPMNMDAWDGYPACRDRVHEMMRGLAVNPVVFAGDTHNAWAFNLLDKDGDAVGVELGTPGISSPGMESWLPVSSDEAKRLLMASSPELCALDASRRGWTRVTLTPDRLISAWRFVSNVLKPEFTVEETPSLVCDRGKRRFREV
jgi:alkaline phosphatase D